MLKGSSAEGRKKIRFLRVSSVNGTTCAIVVYCWAMLLMNLMGLKITY